MAAAGAGGGKSYEEIVTILKDIKKLYEDDDVATIEAARARIRGTQDSTDVLIKDKGIVTDNIFTLARTFPGDQKNTIIAAYDAITQARINYMARHRDLYPARGAPLNHGGKRRNRSRKGRKSSRRRSRKN